MIDKKEMKRNYKETLPPMGIFQFKNLETGRVFIGSSMNLPGKKNSIGFQLKMGSHMNKELQEDYKLLGPDKFVFEIIDELDPKEGIEYDYSNDLKALLELWAEKFDVNDKNCYNTIKLNTDGTKIIR